MQMRQTLKHHTSIALASFAALLAAGLLLAACGGDSGDETASQEGGASAQVAEFIDGALTEELSSVSCTLSDGTETTCNEVTIAGAPANAEIGPFCPETTSTGKKDAGIWLDGENLYDADGEFIVSLPEIYDDPNWKLYDDDGNVRVTDTKEAFEAAARPDVAEEYQNYCVEGQIEFLDGEEPIEATYLIPDDPTNTGEATQISGKVGVTLNGVGIDPSAPIDAILGAYTIAAFDDCGGHINPVEGYHVHAATDCSEVGEARRARPGPSPSRWMVSRSTAHTRKTRNLQTSTSVVAMRPRASATTTTPIHPRTTPS